MYCLIPVTDNAQRLPYAQLSAALQVGSTRELEGLIIDVIYADLLGGKMHHHEQVFHVDWVNGRDLSKSDLVEVKTGLETWCKNTETLLAALDQQIADVRAKTMREAEDQAVYQKKQDEAFLFAREQVANRSKGKDKAAESLERFLGSHADYEDEGTDVPMYEPRGM